jgi:hypothetical protein
MKAVKPVLKLLFVASLIVWTLSRPTVARADGGYYQCDAQWTTDTTSLTQWMNNCMICTHQGGPPNYQFCYITTYAVPVWVWVDGEQSLQYTPSSYNACDDINQSAESCISQCTTEYNQQWNEYFSQDCTLVDD